VNKILIVDFGSQYTQLIARKVRELGVYSEIVPFSTSLADIKRRAPRALILSGGPQSVYAQGAPLPAPALFDLGLPVLGICYGQQIAAHLLGGKVTPHARREYGFAALKVRDRSGLLAGVRDLRQVWMSHGDRLDKIPPGFRITGATANTKAAVIENADRRV